MQANFPALMDMARRAECDRMYYLAVDYYRSALNYVCSDKRRKWIRERIKFCTLAGMRIDAVVDKEDERELSVYDVSRHNQVNHG